MSLLFLIIIICIFLDVEDIKNSLKKQNSNNTNNNQAQVEVKEMVLPSLPKKEPNTRGNRSVWYFGDLDLSFLKNEKK